MAVSVNTSSTQTATVDTEHVLATITDPGTYQLGVDLDNLVNGDIVVLRIKTKLFTGQGSKVVFAEVYAHDQGAQAIALSPPVPAPIEFVATLEQTDGTTGRAFPWAIYQY